MNDCAAEQPGALMRDWLAARKRLAAAQKTAAPLVQIRDNLTAEVERLLVRVIKALEPERNLAERVVTVDGRIFRITHYGIYDVTPEEL